MGSGKSDELKGRAKEAEGALIDDEELKREGQTEQVVGKVKRALQNAIDKVKKAVK